MEVFLALIVVLCFAIGFLLEKASHFVSQLKNSGSAKLKKGFTATVCVAPYDKKSEDGAPHISTKREHE